jgi:uncharacterized protein
MKNKPEKFQFLPFGNIKPTGWLREQMQKDVTGFVGNLDKLVPELINDPIYGSGRLHKHSKSKELGNLKEGDAEGNEQYQWWNSETQSNWWDGYLRNVYLLDDTAGISKVENYVKSILATQDEDGYLGIYDEDLRYKFQSENGELWSKATLYRALLAYYEVTGNEKVFTAVKQAIANVMQHYPVDASSPFESGTSFNGGVSHGLTLTDVLESMFIHTRDEEYRKYASFLYRNFSETYQSEADAQLNNILNPAYKLNAHGVHVFEHLRALIIAAYTENSEELNDALHMYVERLKKATTISGGAIGDEWIAGRDADATHTGYEYCSLHELLDSYCLLFQKTGNAETGDEIERIFYNAAQGSRHPHHSCIAYLKTDNSFEMKGTKNGEIEPDRKQTRYKYSPAHQDVAVCCSPNAGRITPYFIQHSWMKEDESTLIAALLMPNYLETTICGNKISIETETQYPFQNNFKFKISQACKNKFTLKIRKPNWVSNIIIGEFYRIEKEFIVIEREFAANDSVIFSFDTEIQIRKDNSGLHYFSFGALLYALPIDAIETKGRDYSDTFSDFNYHPVSLIKYSYWPDSVPELVDGNMITKLVNQFSGEIEVKTLIPLGKTILRQCAF